MSAKARGIIVSGDVGKLIVEASDAECERFGRGDLVEVGVLRPAPRPRMQYFYGASFGLGVAAWPDFQPVAPRGNAKLETRCGCEKWIQVQLPPPSHVRVAIRDDPFVAVDDEVAAQIVSTRVRHFDLAGIYSADESGRYYRYVEAL